MNRNRFAGAIARLAETFSRDLTPLLVESYQRALRDLTTEEIEIAVDVACEQHERFMPSPAELRRYLGIAKKSAARTLIERPLVSLQECPDCRDTGFVERPCRAGDRCKQEKTVTSRSGESVRLKPECTRDGDHTYNERCGCRMTNENYQRQLATSALGRGRPAGPRPPIGVTPTSTPITSFSQAKDLMAKREQRGLKKVSG